MVLKAPVEIEMRKSKDGLGFNIKGGRDRKFIKARDPRKFRDETLQIGIDRMNRGVDEDHVRPRVHRHFLPFI